MSMNISLEPAALIDITLPVTDANSPSRKTLFSLHLAL